MKKNLFVILGANQLSWGLDGVLGELCDRSSVFAWNELLDKDVDFFISHYIKNAVWILSKRRGS